MITYENAYPLRDFRVWRLPTGVQEQVFAHYPVMRENGALDFMFHSEQGIDWTTTSFAPGTWHTMKATPPPAEQISLTIAYEHQELERERTKYLGGETPAAVPPNRLN